MPINVPESVFDKYFDVIDSTFNIFGVDCKLVYIDKVEVIDNSYDNIPVNPSIRPGRRNNDHYKREDKTYKSVEAFDDIKLKVYWDSRSWVNVDRSNLKLPDNSIQTIFFATDLNKINRAKQIIVHDAIRTQQEMRFEKYGEPFPMGLRQKRYFGCFWTRA